METATRDYPVGDLRVSDADRDRAVAELSDAFQAGRITVDEFEQRSAQALAARTGQELTGLFDDLPSGHAPAARSGDLDRARVVSIPIAMAASATAAVSLTAVAVSNALSTGPSLAVREARRELAQQVLARAGISITVPLPPAAGFDWAGTIIPAVFAVLLVGLIVVLQATRTRRRRLCEHCPMDHEEAQAFAQQWVKDWNAHDVEALLEHFADDVVFTSPAAVRVLGGDGVVRGKEALRTYWSEGIRLIPDLHFEVLALYVGISTVVINYRNQAGGVVSEVLTFEGSMVKEGHGTYLAPAPASVE